MIYVEIDFSEADEREQAAATTHIQALESLGALVTYVGLDSKLDDLKEKLLDHFRAKGMAAGHVLSERELHQLRIGISGLRLNPIEQKALPQAFESFCTSGIFEEVKNAKSLRLTEKGERELYG